MLHSAVSIGDLAAVTVGEGESLSVTGQHLTLSVAKPSERDLSSGIDVAGFQLPARAFGDSDGQALCLKTS